MPINAEKSSVYRLFHALWHNAKLLKIADILGFYFVKNFVKISMFLS